MISGETFYTETMGSKIEVRYDDDDIISVTGQYVLNIANRNTKYTVESELIDLVNSTDNPRQFIEFIMDKYDDSYYYNCVRKGYHASTESDKCLSYNNAAYTDFCSINYKIILRATNRSS